MVGKHAREIQHEYAPSLSQENLVLVDMLLRAAEHRVDVLPRFIFMFALWHLAQVQCAFILDPCCNGGPNCQNGLASSNLSVVSASTPPSQSQRVQQLNPYKTLFMLFKCRRLRDRVASAVIQFTPGQAGKPEARPRTLQTPCHPADSFHHQ